MALLNMPSEILRLILERITFKEKLQVQVLSRYGIVSYLETPACCHKCTSISVP